MVATGAFLLGDSAIKQSFNCAISGWVGVMLASLKMAAGGIMERVTTFSIIAGGLLSVAAWKR